MYLKYLLIFSNIVLLNFNYVSAYSENEYMGDTLSIALPVIAYGSTLYLDDTEGQNQFYSSFFSTLFFTHSLKNIVSKKRPNGGNHSFPSGHSSSAFQGAAFINRRYGLQYGLPSYIAAIFVAYSRVENEFHFNDDVIFGAAIGILSNLQFTTARQNYTISPLITEKSVIIHLTTNL